MTHDDRLRAAFLGTALLLVGVSYLVAAFSDDDDVDDVRARVLPRARANTRSRSGETTAGVNGVPTTPEVVH